MRSLGKYNFLELPKKKKKRLTDALGIFFFKLSFIFIVFSKNAKIIVEFLHDCL